MSIIEGQRIDPDLKFIQLKTFQLANSKFDGSGQCLTIDQNSQTIIACCNSELFYVPLTSLINFDHWTKDFLKSVDNQLSDKVVVRLCKNQVNSHLLSISSKGFGSKLAVCCCDSNQSSFILFYDLKSLYSQKEKCLPYNQCNFSVNTNIPVRIRMLSWHPEMNDNVFACSLTDGSLYILYISDSDKQIVNILSSLNNNNVTSFSWSPKGKQIVVAFASSQFSQFKIQIDDKHLVQSTPLTLAKKVDLPNEFRDYKIINICWISTFNFLIVGYKQENSDSCYMLVSIPSAKATGADAVMKIVDFGCINMESIKNDYPFEVDFHHLDNFIITYTNKSFNFSSLGCLNSSETSSYIKWSEVNLDDDNCLMIPMSKDDFILPRGLALTRGTSQVFKFGSMQKGGIDRNFAIVYSQLGQVTLFLIDFDKQSIINLPKLQANNAVKPVVASLNENSNKILSTISQSLVPSKSIPHQSSLSQLENQPSTVPIATVQNNVTSRNQLESTNTASTIPNSQLNASSEPVTNKQDPDPEIKLDKFYVDEIVSNMKEFGIELKLLIKSQKNVMSKCLIGSSEDFEKIMSETQQSQLILDELTDEYLSLNTDVNNLQSSFIELQYLLEETRSLLARNTDPKYRNLLRQRSLDPITARRVAEIHQLTSYIDVQLRELDNKFDLEWQEFLRQKKATNTKLKPLGHKNYKCRSTPTSPLYSFIDEVPEKRKEKYSVKIIYQALTNNQRLIKTLQTQLESFKDCSTPNSMKNKVDRVADLLNNCSLKSSTKHIVQCLPNKQKLPLKTFLESQHSVPIRLCGPCISERDCTQKSRFLSVLEKIKSEEYKKNKNLVTHSEPKVNKVTVPVQVSKSTEQVPTTTPEFNVTSNFPTLATSSISIVTTITTTSTALNLTDSKSILKQTSFSTSEKTSNNPASNTPTYEDISPVSTPTSDIPSFTFKISPKTTKTTETLQISPINTSQAKKSDQEVKNSLTFSSSSAFSIPSFSASNVNQQQPTQSNAGNIPKSFISANSSPKTSSSFNPPASIVSVITGLPTTQQSAVSGNDTKTTSLPQPTLTSQVKQAQPNSVASPFSSLALPTFSTSLFSNSFPGTTKVSTNAVTTQIPSTSSTPFSSFSFGGALSTLSSNNNVVDSKLTSSTSNETSTINIQPKSTSLFGTAGKTSQAEISVASSVPVSVLTASSTSSLFGSSPFSLVTTASTAGFFTGPTETVKEQPIVSTNVNNVVSKSSFSFNNTLSTLNTSTTSTTLSSNVSSQSTPGFFNQNFTSTFGQSLSLSTSNQEANPTSSSFSFGNLNSLANNIENLKTCEPTKQATPDQPVKNAFGAFALPTGANTSETFNSNGTNSLFGNQTSSMFGANAPSNTLFGMPTANQQSLFSKPSGFSSPPAPNASLFQSPSFIPPNNNANLGVATPAFGASPTFGSSSPFEQATFGGAPSFGNTPVFGSGLSPSLDKSFMKMNDQTIGSFALKDNSTLSFDSLAKPDSNAAFGNSVGFGGSGSFISTNSISHNSDAFTQRRD